ncbi:MAG: F0F1 ATP synthase subunit A [Opitutaceae bacterium]
MISGRNLLRTVPALLVGSLFASSAHAAGGAAAEKLFSIGPLPVTNSMVTSWVISIVLILVIRWAVGRPSLVPSRGQAIVESLTEGVLGLVGPVVGKRVVKAAFPLLAALFVFILIQNWSGLLPGVGTIGWGNDTEHGFQVSEAWIRPGNADINGTLALALVSFVAWLFLIFRFAGPKAILFDLFGNKADKGELPKVTYFFLSILFILVGLIEIISILFRNVSLTFRLFGNVYGGENLLHHMTSIFKWGLPIPFYFLEVLIGFVQALVFALLVAVYIGLICNHGDDHEHEEAEGQESSPDAAHG